MRLVTSLRTKASPPLLLQGFSINCCTNIRFSFGPSLKILSELWSKLWSWKSLCHVSPPPPSVLIPRLLSPSFLPIEDDFEAHFPPLSESIHRKDRLFLRKSFGTRIVMEILLTWSTLASDYMLDSIWRHRRPVELEFVNFPYPGSFHDMVRGNWFLPIS